MRVTFTLAAIAHPARRLVCEAEATRVRYEYKTWWLRAQGASEDRGGDAGVVYDWRQVDMADMSVRIADACNELDGVGFEVLTVTPIQRGQWGTHDYPADVGRRQAGYGFSMTESAIITARKPKEG
jgi:hypothetical protein